MLCQIYTYIIALLRFKVKKIFGEPEGNPIGRSGEKRLSFGIPFRVAGCTLADETDDHQQSRSDGAGHDRRAGVAGDVCEHSGVDVVPVGLGGGDGGDMLGEAFDACADQLVVELLDGRVVEHKPVLGLGVAVTGMEHGRAGVPDQAELVGQGRPEAAQLDHIALPNAQAGDAGFRVGGENDCLLAPVGQVDGPDDSLFTDPDGSGCCLI